MKLDGLLDEFQAALGDILAGAGQEAATTPNRSQVRRRVRRPKQSQFEAMRLKPFVVSSLCQNREKQSHCDELALQSVGYGNFRSVFRQVNTDGANLYIADLEGLGRRANKAKQSQGT